MAVLFHGGFWRQQFGSSIMDAVAVDLVRRGWATWNVEYRRADCGGGVPQTWSLRLHRSTYRGLGVGRAIADQPTAVIFTDGGAGGDAQPAPGTPACTTDCTQPTLTRAPHTGHPTALNRCARCR
ncbi:MAG TPA: hypothetical protein VF003_05950 [Pseudonocardiaceae bacterium]